MWQADTIQSLASGFIIGAKLNETLANRNTTIQCLLENPLFTHLQHPFWTVLCPLLCHVFYSMEEGILWFSQWLCGSQHPWHVGTSYGSALYFHRFLGVCKPSQFCSTPYQRSGERMRDEVTDILVSLDKVGWCFKANFWVLRSCCYIWVPSYYFCSSAFLNPNRKGNK